MCAYVQILERTSEDEVVEANLDSVHDHPHARFCTTLGSGDNRYHCIDAIDCFGLIDGFPVLAAVSSD